MTDQLGLARQTMSTDIWCLVGRIYLFLRQNGKLHYSGKKKKKKSIKYYSRWNGERTLFAFIGFAQHLALISHLHWSILLFLFAYDGEISSCPSNAMELSQPMKYSICLWTYSAPILKRGPRWTHKSIYIGHSLVPTSRVGLSSVCKIYQRETNRRGGKSYIVHCLHYTLGEWFKARPYLLPISQFYKVQC